MKKISCHTCIYTCMYVRWAGKGAIYIDCHSHIFAMLVRQASHPQVKAAYNKAVKLLWPISLNVTIFHNCPAKMAAIMNGYCIANDIWHAPLMSQLSHILPKEEQDKRPWDTWTPLKHPPNTAGVKNLAWGAVRRRMDITFLVGSFFTIILHWKSIPTHTMASPLTQETH